MYNASSRGSKRRARLLLDQRPREFDSDEGYDSHGTNLLEQIARELSANRSGSVGWIARCPSHDDRKPSLTLALGLQGKILFHCHGGCSQNAVLSALRERGLWPDPPYLKAPSRPISNRRGHYTTRRDYQARQLHKARWLWQRSAAATGTPVEAYLQSRGILGPLPQSLRFLPALKPGQQPAMIVAFGLPSELQPGETVMPTHCVKGIHLTLLRSDGTGKADVTPNKLMIGASAGWPMVIAPVSDAGGLAITEGVEDALSLHRATGLGAWAAGAANRLPKLANAVPSYVETAMIAMDDDAAGRRGSVALAQWLHARGLEVIMLAPFADRRTVV